EEGRAAASGARADEGDVIAEVELAGTEVAVLQPCIDVRADRGADRGNQLPCPGVVAVAERLDVSPAKAAAEGRAKAAVASDIEQRIDHGRQHAAVAVEVECRVGDRGPSPGADRRQERRIEAEALVVGFLVAKLAFEPENARVE